MPHTKHIINHRQYDCIQINIEIQQCSEKRVLDISEEAYTRLYLPSLTEEVVVKRGSPHTSPSVWGHLK